MTLLLTFVAAALAIQAQVSDTSPFRALDLPTANRVRSASGAPGPDYWQQRADYVIRATLDSLRTVMPACQRVHLFYAGPMALAFHLGQQISENIHPPVTVWNFSRGYEWGIDLAAAVTGEQKDILELHQARGGHHPEDVGVLILCFALCSLN